MCQVWLHFFWTSQNQSEWELHFAACCGPVVVHVCNIPMHLGPCVIGDLNSMSQGGSMVTSHAS